MKIAFDLDETLGVPVIEQDAVAGFRLRDGASELLERLGESHTLVLWSVSSRRYLEKVLSFGLKSYFREVYSWDDLATRWKDVRRIDADLLIDDSEHHREFAARYGIEERYLVIPAFGSPEDVADPFLWVRRIEEKLN